MSVTQVLQRAQTGLYNVLNKLVILLLTFFLHPIFGQKPVPEKPRILISTDIGGTDPDDNQSMTHLLMYNNLFNIEGLLS